MSEQNNQFAKQNSEVNKSLLDFYEFISNRENQDILNKIYDLDSQCKEIDEPIQQQEQLKNEKESECNARKSEFEKNSTIVQKLQEKIHKSVSYINSCYS